MTLTSIDYYGISYHRTSRENQKTILTLLYLLTILITVKLLFFILHPNAPKYPYTPFSHNNTKSTKPCYSEQLTYSIPLVSPLNKTEDHHVDLVTLVLELMKLPLFLLLFFLLMLVILNMIIFMLVSQ